MSFCVQFLVIFLISFIFIFSIVSWLAIRAADLRFDLIDRPDIRKIHSVPTFKIGGFLILTGYIAGTLVFWKFWFPLELTILLIFITGILGDNDILPARQRLLVQLLIVFIFILFTNSVVKDLGIFELPAFLQIPFTLLGIVGLINAYNIIDCMNGLCSGLGIVSLLTITFLNYLYRYNDISFQVLFSLMPLSLFLIPFSQSSAEKDFKKTHLKQTEDTFIISLSKRYRSRTRSVAVILTIQFFLSCLAILFHRNTYILIFLIILSIIFLRRLWFKRIKVGTVMI